MNTEQLKKYIEQMSIIIRQAGIVALNFQGKVENIGKTIEEMTGDTAQIQADRAAKTLIDNTVQDMLLLTALDFFKNIPITIDAEEETPLVKSFTNPNSELSLIIDPIDGTNNYLHNKSLFSICAGLIYKGTVLNALVFFPKKDEFYFLDHNGKPFVAKQSITKGFDLAEPLITKGIDNNIIAFNNRVSPEVVTNLQSQGFETVEENEMAAALLKCISGEYKAYVEHTPQIRDVLLGAILEKMDNGFTQDWSGNTLQWPLTGRIERVIFGSGNNPNIIKALAI